MEGQQEVAETDSVGTAGQRWRMGSRSLSLETGEEHSVPGADQTDQAGRWCGVWGVDLGWVHLSMHMIVMTLLVGGGHT